MIVSAPERGMLLVTAAHQFLTGHERTGTAARVQSHHALLVLQPDDREHVAADPRHHGLDHIQHGSGGYGGVDRVATVLQHGQPGAGGERLAAGDDPVRRIDGRAARHRAGPILLRVGRVERR